MIVDVERLRRLWTEWSETSPLDGERFDRARARYVFAALEALPDLLDAYERCAELETERDYANQMLGELIRAERDRDKRFRDGCTTLIHRWEREGGLDVPAEDLRALLEESEEPRREGTA
jgi:dsDNA-specific endonuclease/ATPase MutS2